MRQQRIKNTKKNSNIRTSFTQTRERKRIRRMKGGSCNKPISVVGSAWQGGDINTWLNSNHLPLSDSGVSPSPAGINTRDLLFGGGQGKITKKGNKLKHTKKIRLVINEKKKKNKNSSKSKKLKMKRGGSVLIPDDISNLTNSLKGGLTATINGYRGVHTPFQVNNVYPYQQPPYSETYSSNISDANEMYNSADNIVLSTY